MNVKNISFKESDQFSSLIIDYIQQNENLSPLVSCFQTPDALLTIIQHKQQSYKNRNLCYKILSEQYQNMATTQLTQVHLQQLKDEHTFTITTAHQLNIFTGPLYVIYKIAQTIATCRQLKLKYPQYNFIPIYWLGNEDHDIAEINHFNIFNNRIEWHTLQEGASGKHTTVGLDLLIKELQNFIGNLPYSKELITLFENAYQTTTLTAATQYLINELFGNYGLLIIDGTDKKLKQSFIPVMEDELLHQTTATKVNITNNFLINKGYKLQATPRTINLFYIAANNQRNRIDYDSEGATYNISDTTYSSADIIKELHEFPERFSPNVLLRPLYQESILPNIAYIGGSGEISYWLQLKSVFDNYAITFPQLVVRNSALLISTNTQKRIDKIALPISDFFQATDVIKNKFLQATNPYSIEQEIAQIKQQLSQIKQTAIQVDGALLDTISAEQLKLEKIIDVIQQKIAKAWKLKNDQQLQQIEKIKQQLFPNTVLQERTENFSSYYAQYGADFIKQLVQLFDVYEHQFLLINV